MGFLFQFLPSRKHSSFIAQIICWLKCQTKRRKLLTWGAGLLVVVQCKSLLKSSISTLNVEWKHDTWQALCWSGSRKVKRKLQGTQLQPGMNSWLCYWSYSSKFIYFISFTLPLPLTFSVWTHTFICNHSNEASHHRE